MLSEKDNQLLLLKAMETALSEEKAHRIKASRVNAPSLRNDVDSNN